MSKFGFLWRWVHETTTPDQRRRILRVLDNGDQVVYVPSKAFPRLQYCIDGAAHEITLCATTPLRVTVLYNHDVWAEGDWETDFLASVEAAPPPRGRSLAGVFVGPASL